LIPVERAGRRRGFAGEVLEGRRQMTIVGGLDLHRGQITFDVVDTESGVGQDGRVVLADRETLRGWLAGFHARPVELAVEGCTGWRFVVEECTSAGARVHLAEPADVGALKGRRLHAKTDRLGRVSEVIGSR
jgi:transposase